MPRLLGSYGITRPANFSPSDAEIIYTYKPTFDDTEQEFVGTLNAEEVLSAVSINNGTDESNSSSIAGMYDLELPEDITNKVGIYNILIRPKEINATILDCAFLNGTAIKGLVFDRNNDAISDLASLDGYRVEYFENGARIPNLFRIITSTNIVEPISTNPANSTSGNSTTYRVNETSSLFFCTVSPSNSPSDRIGANPFIGSPNQNVVLTNTFFDPIMLTVEITENTLDTIAAGLFGNQLKNVTNGQYGIFDDNGNLIKAFKLAEVLNNFGDKEYEIKINIDNEEDVDLDFNGIRNIIENNS